MWVVKTYCLLNIAQVYVKIKVVLIIIKVLRFKMERHDLKQEL